jgi:hypothetical protein
MVFHFANIDIFTMFMKQLSFCEEMRSYVAVLEALFTRWLFASGITVG